MSEKKIKQSAADYSKDAFLYNPVASATDCTGMTPHIPGDYDEANAYADMLDVPVTALDGTQAESEAR